MPNEQITILGETNYRNPRQRFGIKASDRSRHMYVIGQTGTGKSTLLLNMIGQDIQAGRGLTILDPHGDLVEQVLTLIPSDRIDDVVYFNPADSEYPIGFNPLEIKPGRQLHLVTSGLIEVFKKIWIDSWGPRLEYILRNAILALAEAGGHTLLSIPRLLTDQFFRAEVLRQVKNPVVRSFWEIEYELYPKVFRAETISPIQNKVGQFLSTSLMRSILCQAQTRLDLREVMDNRKILLVNLSKGKLGEDNSALLGSLIVTSLAQAAMSRADTSPESREPFAAYLDEFQGFASESFGTILSEMRKYGLELVLAHQYLAQVPESLRSAAFGNVGTVIAFRVGAEDGNYIEREFDPVFSAVDLISLPSYEMYLKLSINGHTCSPFSAVTLPPPTFHGNAEKIIALSRLRYGVSRQAVDRAIAQFHRISVNLGE